MSKVTKICREKHFWLDLRPMHTSSQASFLPQAISAIGSSNVLWLSKIPVLLQSHLAHCPAGKRLSVEGLGFHGACCSSGRWGAPFWSLVSLAYIHWAAATSGSTSPAQWPGTTVPPYPSMFVQGEDPHTSMEDMGRKASPKPPTAPCPSLWGAGTDTAPFQLAG